MTPAPVTVLTSGVGLGTYIPALLNQRALRAAGHAAELEVLEGWFSAAQRARHLAHKTAFQEDFRLALIANRMPRSRQDALDPTQLDPLLERWASQGRTRFLVWSGFWLPVLERYRTRVPERTLSLDLCRIDAIASASFRGQALPRGARSRDIWLWDSARQRVDWHIPVVQEPARAWAERAPRLVVHGGGWAIGTYAQVLPELARAGLALDVLAPGSPDWSGRGAQDRRFTPSPDWHPWQRGARAEFVFPPLQQLADDGALEALPDELVPPAHTLVRAAQAVVSKPGGGTLIDSLDAATPVVLLEPYGEAEASSGELWEKLGFGIRYERWRESGFDPEILLRLHRNLLEADPRRRQRSYPLHGWSQEEWT